VSKNPEISETRPDPKFSGFLRSDLRNLKFYEVKPDPTRTEFSVSGFFSGFSGFEDYVAHPTNTHRQMYEKIREISAAAVSVRALAGQPALRPTWQESFQAGGRAPLSGVVHALASRAAQVKDDGDGEIFV
jgi:hypothetical protein